jgi:hypothetical protein
LGWQYQFGMLGKVTCLVGSIGFWATRIRRNYSACKLKPFDLASVQDFSPYISALIESEKQLICA